MSGANDAWHQTEIVSAVRGEPAMIAIIWMRFAIAFIAACLATDSFAYTLNERYAALFPRTAISITSRSRTSLNGIYPVDAEAQFHASAVVLYLVVNGRFPGQASGGTAAPFGWLDVNSKLHTGWTPDQFRAFATCIADYVASTIFAKGQIANGSENVIFPSPVCAIP